MRRNKLSKSQRKRKGHNNSKKHDKRSKHKQERLLSFKNKRSDLLYHFNKKRLEEINKIIKEQNKEGGLSIENE